MDVNATDGERGNVQAAGGGPMTSLWSRVSWKKPLSLTYAEESSENPHLERTLGCFDLLMIGIGGTVGSGVFATAGLIAKSYAGPAAVLSWILAGFGCILSGASFMELSGLIPSAGSTYAYAYHSLGEMPAMIAGCLLTLEYGVASAGSARSWSDKFQSWLRQMGVEGPVWMKPKDSSIDLYAGLLMSLCVGIVLCGMSAGKQLINVVTVTKISVVLFIIVVGLTKFDSSNMDPFIAPEHINAVDQVVFGWPGVMLGASASFYGYIGYDEVCCLAAEAKNPTRDIPRAVFGTVVGAAFLSTLATLSLVGMQKYTEIDVAESYGTALRHVGYHWAAPIVEIGEVFTMPVGILIGFLAQPRTLIAGFGLIGIAVCIPFKYLWDFISLGILLAFNLTNTCLLAVRYKSCLYTPACINSASNPTAAVVALFLGVSWLSAYHIQESLLAPRGSTDHWYMHTYGPVAAAVFSVASAKKQHPHQATPFHAPFVPVFPCLAIWFNWFLAVQIPLMIVSIMALYVAVACGVYGLYGLRGRHSLSSQHLGGQYAIVPESP
ncbi:hypothetical protein B5M09_011918 [Aphanomyces astaci]|uniref:Cationic amino acid transporter C-terminal domain-containing protein n=1 Tax=Aphanomyces astaci TaxID=112090 RepID=A0A3R7WA31_APHAT|nr:hypothetical protein B5M09_011918 [Aphanomyces astaci]